MRYILGMYMIGFEDELKKRNEGSHRYEREPQFSPFNYW